MPRKNKRMKEKRRISLNLSPHSAIFILLGILGFPMTWTSDTVLGVCRNSERFQIGDCEPGWSLYVAIACATLSYIVGGMSVCSVCTNVLVLRACAGIFLSLSVQFLSNFPIICTDLINLPISQCSALPWIALHSGSPNSRAWKALIRTSSDPTEEMN